jgi:hypothetical protein
VSLHIPPALQTSFRQISVVVSSGWMSENSSFKKASGHNPFTSAFDEVVAQAIDVCKFPGLSVAVIDSDEDYTKVHQIAISSP